MFLNDKNLTHKSLCKSEVHFEIVFPRLTTRHTLLNFLLTILVGLNHGRPRLTHSNLLKMHQPTTWTDHCDPMMCLHMLSIVLVMYQVILRSFQASFDNIISYDSYALKPQGPVTGLLYTHHGTSLSWSLVKSDDFAQITF